MLKLTKIINSTEKEIKNYLFNEDNLLEIHPYLYSIKKISHKDNIIKYECIEYIHLFCNIKLPVTIYVILDIENCIYKVNTFPNINLTFTYTFENISIRSTKISLIVHLDSYYFLRHFILYKAKYAQTELLNSLSLKYQIPITS